MGDWIGRILAVTGASPWLLVAGAVAAEEHVDLTLRLRVPPDTPASALVAIAGDFQGWRHDDPAHVMERDGDGQYVLVLKVPRGDTIAFRFHRGSVETEEARPDGTSVPARRLRVDQARTVALAVAAWRDDPAPGRTLTGDVTEHSDPAVLDGRRLWVYLPPGYHDTARTYPMLLLLDGQNVFDRTTSFAGEWEVDETCERAIASGRVEALVVVAVDNGQGRRMAEYTPWEDPVRGGGEGREHLRSIVDEVLPWVRANYRVETSPERVGFGGSSLGGLMGLYVAAHRTDVFGRIAALSPSIPWAKGRILEDLRGLPPPSHVKLWMDMGTLEYGVVRDEDHDGVDDLVAALRAGSAALRAAGWTDEQLAVLEDEGARHHESDRKSVV